MERIRKGRGHVYQKDNFLYYKHRESEKRGMELHCQQRKAGCKGMGFFNNGVFEMIRQHNHGPTNVAVISLRGKLKEAAVEQPKVPLRNLFDAVFCERCIVCYSRDIEECPVCDIPITEVYTLF